MNSNSSRPADSAPAAVRTAPAPGGRRLLAYSAAWVVLAVSLLATLGGWWIARRHEELAARQKFEEEATQIRMLLSQRMMVYQDVLHGALGLYAASVSVERSEWRAYVNRVSVNQRFPGIDGLGFIAHVPRERVEEFLQATRADKTPEFQLRQPGTNAALMIVKYLEPETDHAAWLGVDMSPDPEARAVADKARDAGAAVLSRPVNLQDGQAGPTPGLLMLLPVYRNGARTATLEEKRVNLTGWVFARFITAELMHGILEGKETRLRFAVVDKVNRDSEVVIFQNSNPPTETPLFSSISLLTAGQRAWELQFSSKPEFEAAISRNLELLAVAGGGLISVLLFGITLSLNSTRDRAMRMADNMTLAFREANELLQREIQSREANERRTALQHAVTRVLAEAESIAEAAPKIVQTVCENLGWDCGALWQTDPESQKLHCVESWHRPGLIAPEFEADTRRRTFTKGEGLPGRIWASGEPTWIKDVAEDQNFPRAPFAQEAKLHAAFGFPLLLGDKFLGCVEFFSREIVAPDPELLQLVAGLGSQIGQFLERKQARQDLEHEQFLLRTLMDNLPDRIYFKDAQSRFLRNSKAHLQRFSLTDQSDALGKSDFDFFTEEHARQAFEDEQRLMRSGETITVEEKETWPDGSVSWALSTKLPLRDEQGRTVGTFGISRDITDRKRAEEAMRLAKEAAEEANRTKSQFLANMSHELRTPLNSVIGFAGILLKNKSGTLSPTELNFLDRIQANGKHLLTLINEILDLSKIEARKIELQLAPVALDVLVRETLAQQEGLVRDRPVQLLADLPAQVAPLQADAEKLRQVIINLIGNALKFTERGSVTVRVVTAPGTNKPVQIDVVDTGIGIPKDKLGVIFEAFHQADASTARKYGGTGLGLTISLALCRLMGFHITVASEVGRGSTFSIVLAPTDPAGNLAKPGRKTTLPQAPMLQRASDLHSKLVLVIDDESDSRLLLTHLLEEFGCQVIAANSGEQGLRMAREFKPQIITVDLLMPEMDGATVIRALKADPQLRDIPLVVVSIVAEERRGSILGKVDILEKPVARPDLLAALERIQLPSGATILVVDDEPEAREIIAAHLAGQPVRIETAANGREALAVLEKTPVQLVVLDLVMPIMDGLALLETLRTDSRHQQLPVVVVTSRSLSPAEKEQLRRQTLAFVKKTDLSEESFKRLLQRVLEEAENHRGKNAAPGQAVIG
jgi:PAS domain S-box-containing protein